MRRRPSPFRDPEKRGARSDRRRRGVRRSVRRPTAWLAAAGLALSLAIGLGVVAFLQLTFQEGSVGPVAEAETLRVVAPEQITAGEVASAKVLGAARDFPVQLTAIGSLGSRVLVQQGDGNFVLPSEVTRTAGTLTLLAQSVAGAGTAELIVVPAPASVPLRTAVGSRSIVADQQDLAMGVAIPLDIWGNAADAPVRFNRVDPSGTITGTNGKVAGLLAWDEFRSGTLAGTGNVWASSGSITGPAVSLDEVAGRPAPFSLQVDSSAGAFLADANTLVTVTTSDIRDAFNNRMPDGTEVRLRWEGVDGPGSARAVTIAGAARFQVQAPASPGSLDFSAIARGSTSGPGLTVTFDPAVTRAPFTVEPAANNAADLSLRMGPVQGPAGRLAPDGSVVRIAFLDQGREVSSVTGQVTGGQLDMSIPRPVGATSAKASVLGFTSTAVLP